MTAEGEGATPRSRGTHASVLFKQATLENHRGCRECQMREAPVAACAVKKHRRQQLQVRRISRHSLRNGFNGFLRALLGDRAFLPPSLVVRIHELSASVGAPGPRDFAVRTN